MINIDDFKIIERVELDIINKYECKIPNEIIDIWKKYGFGSFKNGYLRLINPDSYIPILEDNYVRYEMAIPLFTTAMGDVLVWEDGYLMILNFRKNEVNVVAKNLKFFFGDLKDEYYLQKALDWVPYRDAIEQYGEPGFDECFGYVPILGLGGVEKVENLQKVKMREHIYIITHFMGVIE